MGASLRGKLLIAAPALTDPNFDRTVVLVLEHGADGALGIVLNRPTETPIADAVPNWAEVVSAPAVVYLGGPVGVGTIIALARSRGAEPPPGTEAVAPGLVAVDLSLDPEPIAPRVHALRIWTRYSGWGPNQLEQELAENAWFVVDAEPVDATTEEPALLWHSVLGRQRGTLAWFSNFPEDPAQN